MFSTLDSLKPALRQLVRALGQRYPYASALAVEDASRRWSISRGGVNIDASDFRGGTGFVLRVFDGVGCAEYSFNRFSEEMIPEIEERVAQGLAAQNAALEGFAGPGKTVLDLGCGSGLLGIGAMLLGCERCAGCDIDPKAPEVALSNAALNGITAEVFDIRAGDVLSDAGMRRALGTGYDIVTANIVADVIIPLSGFVKEFLKPGGTFITSGIIEGRQDEVRAAIEAAGFAILEHRTEDDWHCFVAE